MYLVLPYDGFDTKDAFQAMESMKNFEDSMNESKIQVKMPKFKIESDYNLKSSLNNLGLEKLFNSNEADLTGLNANPNDKSLFVDEIVQKAFIEVNEEGTTAAAATAVITKSMPTPFILDKPFLFYIKDTKTGLNLFSGKLMNPN